MPILPHWVKASIEAVVGHCGLASVAQDSAEQRSLRHPVPGRGCQPRRRTRSASGNSQLDRRACAQKTVEASPPECGCGVPVQQRAFGVRQTEPPRPPVHSGCSCRQVESAPRLNTILAPEVCAPTPLMAPCRRATGGAGRRIVQAVRQRARRRLQPTAANACAAGALADQHAIIALELEAHQCIALQLNLNAAPLRSSRCSTVLVRKATTGIPGPASPSA